MNDLSVRWSKEALIAFVEIFNSLDLRLRLVFEDQGRKRGRLTVEEKVWEKTEEASLKEADWTVTGTVTVDPPPAPIKSPRARKEKGNAKARTKR